MPFKKLHPLIIQTLNEQGITTPNAFQTEAIPKIKSGLNVFGIGEEGCGKTTTILINTLQKLGMKAEHDVPRVLIFVKDREAAMELEDKFKTFIRETDLRIYSVFEEPKIDHQLGEIYPGRDIVIATPKRLNKIYFLNGINFSKLQLCIVDDASFLSLGTNTTLVNRISESLDRCQFLVFADKYDKKVRRLESSFMENSVVVGL